MQTSSLLFQKKKNTSTFNLIEQFVKILEC